MASGLIAYLGAFTPDFREGAVSQEAQLSLLDSIFWYDIVYSRIICYNTVEYDILQVLLFSAPV